VNIATKPTTVDLRIVSDGTTLAVTHTYKKAGTYTAKVTVTDSHGATGSATVQVTVTERTR
jgi:PKD repeat protein